jgi:hypothetical protein
MKKDLEKVLEKKTQNTAQKVTWEITDSISAVHYAGGPNTIMSHYVVGKTIVPVISSVIEEKWLFSTKYWKLLI